jgi:MYXO-CTERM domain-containing protein
VVEGETTSELYTNDKAAYDYFVGQGLASFQAAGIVGNLDQESGVDPNAIQFGGGPGRGIAQWSVGGRWDSSGNDNVVWYASTKGQSPWSLGLQLEFIWYELTTFGYGFSALKATTNVTDATVVFQDKYEICGQCVQSTRIADAQAVLNAYGVAPPYGAKFVSQTWPYASQPAFDVKCGEAVTASIVLKNMGSKTWDANTRLGTTMPRDRASIFTGPEWIGANRPAAISGTVAPGADGTFSFSFHGPTGPACVAGVHMEYFGVVQEGVSWFSDTGEGGPPDNQLEALINIVPVPMPPPPDMANGAPTGQDAGPMPMAPPDLGTTPTSHDAGTVGHDAATRPSALDAGASGDAEPGKGVSLQGCSVAAGGKGGHGGLALLLLFGACVRRRRAKGQRATQL